MIFLRASSKFINPKFLKFSPITYRFSDDKESKTGLQTPDEPLKNK